MPYTHIDGERKATNDPGRAKWHNRSRTIRYSRFVANPDNIAMLIQRLEAKNKGFANQSMSG